MEYTPNYIEKLLPNQIFVFGSNILGYHTGGASRTAKKFGAVWGQAEGLQGQSYAIPVDFGKGNAVPDMQPYVDRFIAFAKEHSEKQFLVTRVGCGIAGFTDDEMAMHFREALNLENVSLPRSFVNALQDGKEKNFDLERFVAAQDGDYGSYNEALEEIKSGRKTRHWIWYIFPQIKGLGFSCNSEYYGLSGIEEAQAYLNHPMLGMRLREISQALLNIDGHSAHEILGSPDDMKVQSCMTLFDIVSPNDIFKQVLDRYYMGEKCPKTVMRIERRQTRPMLRKLTISKDYRVLLGDKEIRMEPLLKAIYLLYLKHPEGIVFKSLPDYRGELTEIYNHLKPRGMNAQVLQSIEDVTNPLLNSINEKCSRIKAIFMDKMDEILANNYIILGKSGKTKKILLNRNLVVWE